MAVNECGSNNHSCSALDKSLNSEAHCQSADNETGKVITIALLNKNQLNNNIAKAFEKVRFTATNSCSALYIRHYKV
ncbi:hypothetical protein PNI02_09430 [Pseudoalteromonas nigrifaciens]|nr:hypothetical protein PNI02_09430 [Pseudoalteromonas nigrifaciens]